MRKLTFYFLLLGITCVVFSGCGNTIRGMGEDTKKNWETMSKWDDKFQENYW